MALALPVLRFNEKWADCELCKLAKTRRRVVLWRGMVPCDLLFIGEGPGRSEDNWGVPFIGPAGKLMDDMVGRANIPGVRIAYSNMVCCIPVDSAGAKVEQPLPEEIRACSGRLLEFIGLAKPKLIITVGEVATDYTDPKLKGSVKLPSGIPTASMVHPSAILKGQYANKWGMIQRNVVAIKMACTAANLGIN